jgi:hypothetical protein
MKNRSQLILGTIFNIIVVILTTVELSGGQDKPRQTAKTNKASNRISYRLTNQSSPAIDLPLWYNGDGIENNGFNGNGFLAVDDCQGSFSAGHIYDDFIVSSPNGWHVTSIYENQDVGGAGQLAYMNVYGATWEIRQGMSDGNPGTLIATGVTYTPTVTAIGTTGFYQVLVDGLDLTLAPGTYWLNVTPIGLGYTNGTAITGGVNCIGSPCGNDQNSFDYDPDFGYVWAAAGADFSMGVNGVSCPGNCFLLLVYIDSKKILSSGQVEKIPLPMTGESGVEDRSGKPGGNFTVEMTFTNNVISFARASSSCGRVASTSINGSTLTVNLTGVSCNASNITVTANDVKDDAGTNVATACVTMGLLLGDVDGNRVVDSNDLAIVRSQLGQPTNDTNLRSDVNNDGTIDNADLQIVTRQVGTRLP